MNLIPPDEHHLLVFWVAMLVLVAAARLLGALSKRVGQPAVIGELAAGLLLGPSVLGRLAPDVTEWLFPPEEVQTAMLFTIGWLGVLLLLIATGFETDLALIRRLGIAAVVVSTTSLVIPMAMGYGTGVVMPDTLVGEDTPRYIFALFIAAALSISSLPVIAKILGEMGFLRRNFGQLTLACGMANDVVGWVVLGIIAGLARAGGVDVTKLTITVAGVAVLFVFALTIGQRITDVALRSVRRGGDDVAGIAVILLVALAAGVFTQWLGVEAVLGAFVAGIVLGRSRFHDMASMHRIEALTSAFFAPVFFATAGLRVDLGLLFEGDTFLWALIVLAVASISKFVGALVGAKIVRLSTREGMALGVGLNARGALEIVIAALGLSLGVLTDSSYALVVLMAMATSMMAPPMLRAVLSGWKGSEEEQVRLEKEEALRTNVLVRNQRVLIATRGRASSLGAGRLVDLVWPDDIGVTLLTVTSNGDSADAEVLSGVFEDRPVERRVVSNADPVQAILDEAKLGYGAIVISAGDMGAHGGQMSPLVESLLARSTLPVMIVRRRRDVPFDRPWTYERAVVPVVGTKESRAAREVAFGVSVALGTEVVLSHIVERGDGGEQQPDEQQPDELVPVGVGGTAVLSATKPRAFGRRLLDEAAADGRRQGAELTTVVEHAPAAGDGLKALVNDQQADLVVVGTALRVVDGHPFLGHTVEQLLEECPVTTVVVATPTV